MKESREIIPQEEQKYSVERLLPADVLPTRRFVIELPGFKRKVPEPRFVGRGYQMKWVIYPNWVGVAEIDGREITSQIAIYYANTRFLFVTDESREEWLLNEDGGRGFTLQLYNKGMDTEAIVGAFFRGADFYADVPYKERKKVSYAWHWPEPDHLFPVVTLRDIDFGEGKNIQQALNVMEKLKQLLLRSEHNPKSATYFGR